MSKVLIAGEDDQLTAALVSRSFGTTTVQTVSDVTVEDLGDIDTVLHLRSRFEPSSLSELLAAAVDCGVGHFVHGSSTCVYGAWPDNPVPLTEDAPLRPNTDYPRAVRLAEAERLVSGRSNEMRVTILRFCNIIGATQATPDLAHLDLYRHRRSTRPMQFLHLDDACGAVEFVVDRALAGTYNVAPVDFIDDVKARAIAGTTSWPDVPERIAHLANDAQWRLRHRSAFAGASNYFDHPWVVTSEALRDAGWSPRHTSSETIASQSRPDLWNRLNPQRRRDLVSASVVSGAATAAASVAGAAVLLAMRRRNRS